MSSRSVAGLTDVFEINCLTVFKINCLADVEIIESAPGCVCVCECMSVYKCVRACVRACVRVYVSLFGLAVRR